MRPRPAFILITTIKILMPDKRQGHMPEIPEPDLFSSLTNMQ